MHEGDSPFDPHSLADVEGDFRPDARTALFYGLALMRRTPMRGTTILAGRFVYRLVGPHRVPVRVYRRDQTGSYVRRRWLGRHDAR